jgi:hypothetical protein
MILPFLVIAILVLALLDFPPIPLVPMISETARHQLVAAVALSAISSSFLFALQWTCGGRDRDSQ